MQFARITTFHPRSFGNDYYWDNVGLMVFTREKVPDGEDITHGTFLFGNSVFF